MEHHVAIVAEGWRYRKAYEGNWIVSNSGNLVDLEPNTQYEFYAYITTDKCGEERGDVLRFTTLDDVVGVDEVNSVGLSLYPNPASDYLTVCYKPTCQPVRLLIMDAAGKVVLDTMLSSFLDNVTLKVSSLDDGICLIKIISGNYVKTERFFVKHK